MTHRGPFQPLLFCGSVKKLLKVYLTLFLMKGWITRWLTALWDYCIFLLLSLWLCGS